jgi:hypothetical protein
MVRGAGKQWRGKGSKPRPGAPKGFKSRGGFRGRGRGGAKRAQSSEELNKELAIYWGDKGGQILDKDMENYWKSKSSS